MMIKRHWWRRRMKGEGRNTGYERKELVTSEIAKCASVS
jgi:hypothetical protein